MNKRRDEKKENVKMVWKEHWKKNWKITFGYLISKECSVEWIKALKKDVEEQIKQINKYTIEPFIDIKSKKIEKEDFDGLRILFKIIYKID